MINNNNNSNMGYSFITIFSMIIKYSFISTKHKNSKIYGLIPYNTAILQTHIQIKLYIKRIIKAKFI
jgi:hypothetical protein